MVSLQHGTHLRTERVDTVSKPGVLCLFGDGILSRPIIMPYSEHSDGISTCEACPTEEFSAVNESRVSYCLISEAPYRSQSLLSPNTIIAKYTPRILRHKLRAGLMRVTLAFTLSRSRPLISAFSPIAQAFQENCTKRDENPILVY
jgi:hypothetical protein